MTERHFFTDTTTASLSYIGDEDSFRDAVDGGFDSSQADTVILDSPWTEFFGTDEFVQFKATVAQPIVQPYLHDGQLRQFRKPESELRDAQAQLESAPWTMGHPEGKTVTSNDQIRGFWSDPYWDDGQQATLNIPADDTESLRFAVTNDEVSVGFSGVLDWTDEDGHDANQRNIVYDHVASVENGRCPREKGCGLHVDEAVTDGADGDLSVHGHVTDAVQTKMTEEEQKGGGGEMDPQYSEGDWVRWDWSGGSARGRITNVSTSQTLSVDGTSRDPTEEGEPVYKAKHWDDGEWGNMKVAYESNLEAADQPANFTDGHISSGCSALCSPGPCSCGLHDPLNTPRVDAEVNGESINLVPPEAAQQAAQDALDARDDEDVTVNGMTDHGWSRAEQLASGEELSPSDIVGSSGAMAPWWSRHASHTVEGDSLAGADTENPWSDNSYTAGKGWGGITGYEWAIRKGNEIKRAMGEEPTYSTDADISVPSFTEGDLVKHRYIDNFRGYVAHNPADRPYVMVDPLVDGEVNNHTMTFGTADLERISKTDGPSEMRTDGFTDATTVMDTITYEDTMGGDLDESEIPNDDYEQHYVFDAETKDESSFPLVDAEGNLRRENVIAAASYSGDAPDESMLMDVLREVNGAFDDPPLDEETLATDVALASFFRHLSDTAV